MKNVLNSFGYLFILGLLLMMTIKLITARHELIKTKALLYRLSQAECPRTPF